MLKRRIFILLFIFLLLLCSCQGNDVDIGNSAQEDNEILVIVNGEKIWYSEFEQTKERYALQNELTDTDLIEGIILEAIVLGIAEKYDIIVTEKEVDEMLDELKRLDENGMFYDKVIEIYGTVEKVKEAYYYGILYDKVREMKREDFLQVHTINENLLRTRVNDYVLDYNLFGNEKEEFRQAVEKVYMESMQSELFELFFKVWQCKQIDCSDIEYISVREDSLFENKSYSIDEKELTYKGEHYLLEEWSLLKYQELFGNILYFPNSILADYDNIKIVGVYKPAKDVKAVYIQLEEDSSDTLTITAVVSPYIYFNYKGDGWMLLEEKGIENRIELINCDYGIHFMISGKKECNELKSTLKEFISIRVNE